MERLYSSAPDGYCGDEDNGQTSAWYVFSALGFYPVCPASDQYAIGIPLFRKAVINLENGRKVKISGGQGRLVTKTRMNGKAYDDLFLNYSDLIKGATLDFEME